MPEATAAQSESQDFSDGVDYAILTFCEMLGIDKDSFSWDAATEEFDGDVRAVIGNCIAAKFGEAWMQKDIDIRMRRVEWAVGVYVPYDANDYIEHMFRQAYETGLRRGAEKVREPIIEALGIDDRFEPCRD